MLKDIESSMSSRDILVKLYDSILASKPEEISKDDIGGVK